jgi:hypothetical protein
VKEGLDEMGIIRKTNLTIGEEKVRFGKGTISDVDHKTLKVRL